MARPLITEFTVLLELAPLAAALVRQPVRGPRLGIVLLFAVLAGTDAAMGWLASLHIHNLFLQYVLFPVSGVIALWTLAEWQEYPGARRAMRIAAPVQAVVMVALMLLIEDVGGFSRIAGSVSALLLLAAALFTLVTRSLAEPEPLPRQDWFWITGGLTLYFGADSTLGPLIAMLLERQQVDMFYRAYTVRCGIDIVAFLLIAWGMTCPTAARLSRSSSPSSPPSGSSSSPSARP